MNALDSNSTVDDAECVFVPISRVRSLAGGLAWCLPAVGLLVVSSLVYRRLDFQSSVVSSRLVDYALVLAILPLVLGGLGCAAESIRWIALSVWPGRIGVFADRERLSLRLGPFGSRDYAAADLEIKYPFELTDEITYESLLPEEKQRNDLLPQIRHPKARKPLNLDMMRFLGTGERQITQRFRVLFDLWRKPRVDPP